MFSDSEPRGGAGAAGWRVAAGLAACLALVSPRVTTAGCVSPPNEQCAGAVVFSTADLPFSTGGPLGCVNDVVDKPYFDVFYRYDCTQTGIHVLEMCDSSGDTYLRVYRDGCGWAAGTELATADDECPGSPPNADPRLAVELQAGESYWIEVGTWRDVPPWAPPLNSPYVLSVTLEGQATPLSCDGSRLATRLVGESGNAPDTNGLGAVGSLFRSGRFEVTNRDYVDFLNRVAAADPGGLYDPDMTASDRGGILRGGAPGSFSYWVKESFGDKPVNFLTWTDAARFANWLHNGRPSGAQAPGTTEAGAYDLSLPAEQIQRTPSARFFLPTHDEWYKAAYFDPFDPGADAGGTPDYWLYPTSSDVQPAQATADAAGEVTNPGANVANFDGGAVWNGESGNVTTVGGTTSESAWGCADLAGNVLEMTETLDTPIGPGTPTRTARGGDFASAGILMSSPAGFGLAIGMDIEAANLGFRLAAEGCRGDLDGDNDVDADDSSAFEGCFTGPGGGPVGELCALDDFDGDGDVDCPDWGRFAATWTAPGNAPPLAACAFWIFSDGFEPGSAVRWSASVP